ncbi:hypothetical protein [Prevotella jejuni]|uniref:hypothetical protein n=1 Tax=Prevotella jejuni TaxID=1177574 RepID=UPI001BA92BC7|nr:hypothetical protein [Prevotella jejuni]QUB79810.1 hypothetical protein J4857_10655 [Prevotella jejuni]
MRAITDEHLQAYLKGGCLQRLFNVIKEDPELSFEIRVKNEVMIYYHKDRILTISYCKGKPSIDTLSEKYYKNDTPPSVSFEDGDLIQTLRDKSQLRQYFREAKRLVGRYKVGEEFEVQQNIALGNRSFSNRFVVVDMEWQLPQSDIKKEERISKTRFDLVVVDMKRNERGENDVYLGELKVGMGATGGKSGIVAHIEKTNEFMKSSKACAVLRADVERIIRQKAALGLLEGDYAGLNLSATPRMMLILAYRGNKEKNALKVQEKNAKDEARKQNMVEPLVIWHKALITLKV